MKAFDKFYDYQLAAKAACKGQPKGIVCLPTGTGKTYLEAGIIAETILAEPGFQTYVINAPRILLSFQLCKEVYQFLTQCGVEARYMFVHSGGSLEDRDIEDIRIAANMDNDVNIPYSNFLNGTTKDSITKAMEIAKEDNLPLILIATYHSCERVELARKDLNLPPIRLVINDEAHYLVQEQFFDILHTLTYKQCLFFTATTKTTVSPEGRGMNNEDAYGPLLYTLTPREAMDKGRIVRPRLHFVTTKYKIQDVEGYTNYLILQAFDQHTGCLNTSAKSRDASIPGIDKVPLRPKLLVALQGVGDIVEFLGSEEYIQMRSAYVNIFAISSNAQVNNNINGNQVTRPEFLKQLKLLGNDPTKSILALHFDILAEGIDVNGFTGILALRALTKSKFIQSYGRTARLHPTDRKNIENKVVIAWEWMKQMKPFSYVLIPDITNQTNDQKAELIGLIEVMREYGYDFAEHIIGDQLVRGVTEEDPLGSILEPEAKQAEFNLQFKELIAELEAADAASLASSDPAAEFTLNRATALGLGRRITVITPKGKGVVTGFSGEQVIVNLENGKPAGFKLEELTK